MGSGNGPFRDLNPMLLYVGLVGSLGAMSFGYDNGWWGFVLGAPYFNAQYGGLTTVSAAGVSTTTLTSVEQSIGTGMGTAGIMIGCMLAPSLNEWRGRKFMFYLLAVVSIIGATVQALSTIKRSYACLIAGKVILNIGVGFAAAVVAGYLSECSPASLRGAMVMQYNVIQNVGYVASAVTIYGVINRSDMWNWLAPIVVQFGLPCLILALTPFLPESPRWLVSKGRLEEAAQSITKLRGGPSRVDEAEVHAEVEEIKAAFDEQRSLHNGNGWLELFKGNNLRRTGVAVGLQCLQQAQGVGFVASYLIITFIGIGITNVYLIVLGIYIELLCISTFGTYLTDRLGRRFLLITGGIVQACCMFTSAAICTYTASPTGALANLLIATFFIWVAVFSVSWSPIPWTVAAEISSNPLREKTLALAAFLGFGVGLAVGFISPYISSTPGNLGGRIGYLWGGFSVISVAYAYFMVPELKNRSLEELDYMFETGLSARKFATFDASHLLAEKHAAAHARTTTASQGYESQAEEKHRGSQEYLEEKALY